MATSVTPIATGHGRNRLVAMSGGARIGSLPGAAAAETRIGSQPVALPGGVRIGSRMWGALSWLGAAWFRGWMAYVRSIRSRSREDL